MASIIEDEVLYMLFRKDFFYSALLQRVCRVETTAIPTAAVLITDKIILLINPIFYKSLSRIERVAILKHELLHVLNQHIGRLGTRDPYVFNLATDLAINQFIPDLPSGSQCPKCSKFFHKDDKIINCPDCDVEVHAFDILDINNFKVNGKKLTLPPKELAEIYYSLIYKKIPQITLQAGRKYTAGQSNSVKDIVVTIEGKGEESGDSSEKDSEKNNSGNGEDCPKPLDNHATWQQGPNSKEVNDELIKSVVKASVEAARSQGNVPADLEGIIKKLFEHKTLSWRTLVRQFVGHQVVSKKRPSKTRLNRRLPMPYFGSVTDYKARILVIVDSSGSVADKEIACFFSEIDRIYDSGLEIILGCCDMELHPPLRKYSSTDRKGKKITIQGRGGTTFVEPFELVRKGRLTTRYSQIPLVLKEKVDGIIYFTDLWGDFPKSIPVPTLWVATYDHNQSASEYIKTHKLGIMAVMQKDEIQKKT